MERAGEPPSAVAAPASPRGAVPWAAMCPAWRGTGVTGEPPCPLSPGREATRHGGSPVHSGVSWDALWCQEWDYNPSRPQIQGLKVRGSELGSAPTSRPHPPSLASADPGGAGTHLSTCQGWARVQAPGSPRGWQRDRSTGALLPQHHGTPSLPAPPPAGPARAAPCARGPRPAPPCTCRPRVPPGPAGFVPCRAVPSGLAVLLSAHHAAGRTGRVTLSTQP